MASVFFLSSKSCVRASLGWPASQEAQANIINGLMLCYSAWQNIIIHRSGLYGSTYLVEHNSYPELSLKRRLGNIVYSFLGFGI